MVRPHSFGFNPETAASNSFQQTSERPGQEIQATAVSEFDRMVQTLEDAGVNVMVFEDTELPIKPDAVFPNNWVSSHADGTVCLYPMESANRRAERRLDIVESLSQDFNFFVREIIDFSSSEAHGLFLEGTGSMVLDRTNRVAYAAQSSRTHMDLLAEFGQKADYDLCIFEAIDSAGDAIYHTNVMMSIGDKFVVVCADSIGEPSTREAVLTRLEATGRDVIEISVPQLAQFAGNIIEVEAAPGSSLIVMSRTAHRAMTAEQLERLGRCGRVLPVQIDTIEQIGGGSVRCMIAEVFLPHADVSTRKESE
jgi:hypothetical protein